MYGTRAQTFDRALFDEVMEKKGFPCMATAAKRALASTRLPDAKRESLIQDFFEATADSFMYDGESGRPNGLSRRAARGRALMYFRDTLLDRDSRATAQELAKIKAAVPSMMYSIG